MKVNKELVQKVGAAMLDLCRDPDFKFSYDNLLDSYKLRHDVDKELNGSHMICCPFHDDEDPSLAIYDDDNLWYCYGCQRRGDPLQFVTELYKLYDSSATRSSVANALLKENSTLREVAGIDTIYTRESSLTEMAPIPFSRFKVVEDNDLNYLMLADKVKKTNDKEKIIQSILLMQEGLNANDIDQALFKQKSKQKYDINQMWE